MAIKLFWTLSILTWLFTTSLLLYIYSDLPNTVATHINLKGEVDSYADKKAILILPLINIGLTVMFIVASVYVKHLNFPHEITADNRKKPYNGMRLFLSIFSVIINLIYFIIAYGFYIATSGLNSKLIIFMLTLFYIVSSIIGIKMLKKRSK